MGFGLMDFDGDGHRDLVWDTTNKHEIRIGYVYIYIKIIIYIYNYIYNTYIYSTIYSV